MNTTSSGGFTGTYTTHADIKRWNRDAEAVTESAEAIAFAFDVCVGAEGRKSAGVRLLLLERVNHIRRDQFAQIAVGLPDGLADTQAGLIRALLAGRFGERVQRTTDDGDDQLDRAVVPDKVEIVLAPRAEARLANDARAIERHVAHLDRHITHACLDRHIEMDAVKLPSLFRPVAAAGFRYLWTGHDV